MNNNSIIVATIWTALNFLSVFLSFLCIHIFIFTYIQSLWPNLLIGFLHILRRAGRSALLCLVPLLFRSDLFIVESPPTPKIQNVQLILNMKYLSHHKANIFTCLVVLAWSTRS